MSTTERQRTSARRDSLLGDQPGAFASARYVRITPLKARRVVDLVRGMPVEQALSILEFAPQAAAETVHKVLRSAVANAETTEGLDTHDLVVSVAHVDVGPTMKRWRPRAQGRATRINKRTSHITLAVQPASVVAAEPAKKAKPAATKAEATSEPTRPRRRRRRPRRLPPRRPPPRRPRTTAAAATTGEDA